MRKNVIRTSEHDIESHLLLSGALDKVLREFGSAKKIIALNLSNIQIRELLRDSVHPLGTLRLYSLETNAGLDFDNIKWRFLDRALSVDVKTMIVDVFNHSKKGRPDYTDVVEYIRRWQAREHNKWMMCCGHDLLHALSRALQSKLGSQTAQIVGPENMSKLLRLAYGWSEFRQSSVHRAIRRWERANPPYRFFLAAT